MSRESPNWQKERTVEQASSDCESERGKEIRGELQLRSRIVSAVTEQKTARKRTASVGRSTVTNPEAREQFLKELQEKQRARNITSGEETEETVSAGIESEKDSESEEIIKRIRTTNYF